MKSAHNRSQNLQPATNNSHSQNPQKPTDWILIYKKFIEIIEDLLNVGFPSGIWNVSDAAEDPHTSAGL